MWFTKCMYEQSANMNYKWITATVKQILQVLDQFIQKWSSDVNNSSKGQTYRIFKQNFGFENYIKISPKFRTIFMKFRTTNHHLPMETGRWHGLPLCDRIHVCTLCKNTN